MSHNSSSNYRRNKAFIDQYRKELKSMFDDISDIDVKVLNKSVNVGLADVKRNTPVVTGFMRKSWGTTPAIKTADGVTKTLENSADYSSYVNYGHGQEVGRYVPAIGKKLVKPWVPGQFMLEKAISKAEKTMRQEFEKEVKKVNRDHDK